MTATYKCMRCREFVRLAPVTDDGEFFLDGLACGCRVLKPEDVLVEEVPEYFPDEWREVYETE